MKGAKNRGGDFGRNIIPNNALDSLKKLSKEPLDNAVAIKIYFEDGADN